MASAMGTLRRPMEMISRGQGGSRASFEAVAARRALGGTRSWNGAGKIRIGPFGRTRFRVKGRPTASATAMPCASMPTEPSVTIQVLSARALRLSAISAAAPEAAPARAASGALKFPEWKTLNFFSILLLGGRKIAQSRNFQTLRARSRAF